MGAMILLLCLGIGFPPPNIAVRRTPEPDLFPSMDIDSKGEPFIAFEWASKPDNHDVVIYRWVSGGWNPAWTKTGGYWFYNDSIDHRQPALGIDTHDRIYLMCKGRGDSRYIKTKWFWLRSDDYGESWQATVGIGGTEWYGNYASEPVIGICKEGLEAVWFVCQRSRGEDSDIEGVYMTEREFIEHAAISSSDKERRPWVAVGLLSGIIVYEYYNGEDWDVYGVRSMNVGPHVPPPLEDPVPIGFEPGIDELQPCIATKNDVFVCAYKRGGDIYLGYSEGGDFFETIPAATSSEEESRPAVTTDGEKAYLAYYRSGNIYLKAFDLYTHNWSSAYRVTDQPTALDTPRVVICMDSLLYIAWVDNRNGNPDIYFAQVDPKVVPTGIKERGSEGATVLLKIYPNPLKESSTISIQLPAEGKASLEIYDATGRIVKSLIKSQNLKPGTYTLVWDGKDSKGSDLPSGIYFVKLKLRDRGEVRSVVLIR